MTKLEVALSGGHGWLVAWLAIYSCEGSNAVTEFIWQWSHAGYDGEARAYLCLEFNLSIGALLIGSLSICSEYYWDLHTYFGDRICTTQSKSKTCLIFTLMAP